MYEFQRKPKIARMGQVEALMALRNLDSKEAKALIEKSKGSFSDELNLEDRWIKIHIDNVCIDLHYGVPIYPYELMVSLAECYEYGMDGLFAGIMPDTFQDPFSFNPNNIMHLGFAKLNHWANSLWLSVCGNIKEDFDFDAMCKKIYICLDKKDYKHAKARADHRSQMHEGFPGRRYTEMLEYKRYYLLLN